MLLAALGAAARGAQIIESFLLFYSYFFIGFFFVLHFVFGPVKLSPNGDGGVWDCLGLNGGVKGIGGGVLHLLKETQIACSLGTATREHTEHLLTTTGLFGTMEVPGRIKANRSCRVPLGLVLVLHSVFVSSFYGSGGRLGPEFYQWQCKKIHL